MRAFPVQELRFEGVSSLFVRGLGIRMNRSVLDDGFLSDHPYFSRIAISDENHPNNFQIFILSRTALVPYIVILLFV